MRDWASSGQQKIQRAYDHISELDNAIAAYRARNPYYIEPENTPDDINPFGTAFIIRVREDIPPMWEAIAADAVHNLRTALDHLWRRITPGSSGRRDLFPTDPDKAKARFQGRQRGRMRSVGEILSKFGVFDPGNPFSEIGRFDNTDKHDSLALVAIAVTGLKIDARRSPNLQSRGGPEPRWTFIPATERSLTFPTLEDGAALYAPGFRNLDVDADISFEIAFAEGESLSGRPVIPTLNQFATAVNSLAAAFVSAELLDTKTGGR